MTAQEDSIQIVRFDGERPDRRTQMDALESYHLHSIGARAGSRM